ncbi:MAG: OmpA family protein [Treponema sp.]|nr:OmpA family protein [Treponema sp.]
MKKSLFFITTLFMASAVFSQVSLLESRSKVNWTKREFKSNINLNVDKADIPMPSGRQTAINLINTRVPDLVKDPLLTLNVDSSRKISDLVLDEEITYHDLADIISTSKCTTGYFAKDSSVLNTNHTMELSKLSSLFVKHSVPYKPSKPISQVSSKKYSGIIIDARGKLPVHGEFMIEEVAPCFFPRIFNDEMDLIYEKNMVDPALIRKTGICYYDYSDDESRYTDIVGNNPLHILALESFGDNRSDIIIKKEDALRILCVKENYDLLKNGKIVILLEKDQLIYDVAAPVKDEAYYTAVAKLKMWDLPPVIGPDQIVIGPDIKFLYNLKFIPDSPELLPEELPRIKDCAQKLKDLLSISAFTIFVGGHTADIGQPVNQMNLSKERAITIINALIKEGIPQELFSYRGYGATVPAKGGDNKTPEGRAVNRRVEITLRPRTTYIQRAN